MWEKKIASCVAVSLRQSATVSPLAASRGWTLTMQISVATR